MHHIQLYVVPSPGEGSYRGDRYSGGGGRIQIRRSLSRAGPVDATRFALSVLVAGDGSLGPAQFITPGSAALPMRARAALIFVSCGQLVSTFASGR
jgi:hypothetical protein